MQPALAQGNCWELFKELHYDVAVRLEMDSDPARHILQRRGPGGLKHIEIPCLAIQHWVREKRLSVSRVDTKNNTANLFTKHLDGLRTQSLAKKLGFESWMVQMVQMVRMERTTTAEE